MTALSDWFHLATDIGDRSLKRDRVATADERIELARELDILSCERLAVSYTIASLGSGRFRFSGTLEAALTQACVVSLAPVPAEIFESFSVELAPAETLGAEEPLGGDQEVLSLPDIEPIEDGRIEVGTLVFAILSSSLEAYPRAPGVAFEWVDPKVAADPDAARPFAALAKLKPKS